MDSLAGALSNVPRPGKDPTLHALARDPFGSSGSGSSRGSGGHYLRSALSSDSGFVLQLQLQQGWRRSSCSVEGAGEAGEPDGGVGDAGGSGAGGSAKSALLTAIMSDARLGAARCEADKCVMRSYREAARLAAPLQVGAVTDDHRGRCPQLIMGPIYLSVGSVQ